jgi:hypothetical protein
MKKNLKRGALLAASAATVLSLTIAAPSFAHDGKAKGPRAGSSSSADRPHSADQKHSADSTTGEKHEMGEGKKKGKGVKGDRKHQGQKKMGKAPAAPTV